MGGGIDGKLGISSMFSPQQSTNLEKTQAELRQMFTAAEQFRRELEFLQKGGNPLDLKAGSAASVSVQSTSLTDLHPEQFVTSEAKGSFAVTASPHGDSVGSSGRLGGISVCEPNSADNLVLFGGNNKFRELERRSVRPPTSNTSPSKHCSLLDSGQNARESGDSAALELPKKSYKRRVRSRPNRDGPRSTFPFHHASRDVKGLAAAANPERNGLSSFISKPKGSNSSMAIKNEVSNSRLDMELDGSLAVETTLGRVPGPSSAVSDANVSQNPRRKQHDQLLKSDTLVSSPNMDFIEPESFEGVEKDNLGGSQQPPCVDRQRANNFSILGQTNGMPHDGTFSAAISTKGLDSESSCTQNGQSLDVNNENKLPASPRNINCNGTMEQILGSNEVPGKKDDNLVKEKEGKILNIANNNNNKSCHRSYNEDDFVLKEEEGLKGSESSWQIELKKPVSAEGVKPNDYTVSETEKKPSEVLGSNFFPQGGNATCTSQGSNGKSFLDSTLPVTSRTDVAEQSACFQNNLKLATKEHEESILEEARIIEAKRKRIAELSVSTLPLQSRQTSHWDFVLEEMSWLANDFAQERLWKLTAAAQISRRVAYASQVRNQQQNSSSKQKEVAQTLGRVVMEFWHTIQVNCKELELQCLNTDSKQGLRGYAMKFLEYNSTHVQYNAAQVPLTPDLISDVGIIDIAWVDNLTEENLVYTVPPGAAEAYRKSIESHLLQSEGGWGSLQEEVGTSGYDTVADNAFEEDDEMREGYLPGEFASKSSKATKKRRKNFKFCSARAYETGNDLPFMQPIEKNIGTHPSVLNGKRSGGSLNVPIPTKHVRTGSRQRVVGPFNTGTSSFIQTPNKADASSGDTDSFQDEQSTPHGGSHIPNYMEAESVGDYEKQLQFDSVDVSDRPRKKKKAKHLGSSFDHRWQPDSQFQNDQKDHSKRRLDAHQLDSNGSNGLYIQHNMKKLKMRQSSDNSFDNLTPMARSIPSPVTSQMSNMSNPKKFMELLVRDRGRKSKTVKIPAGQPGSGTPWSLFEDQFLVVLVHDMGPNWELISDAINSTLQVKSTFRNSKECKERHKILMDRNTGDGADSAEDSGSSQPYPSTLPGIPEGSARQLFQRLQGPMEEDTLKSHFEKIITIGKKQYYRTQNENQDSKQLQQPHSSHTLAISQVSPNNLNGGPVLTPLELCDTIATTPDAPNVGHRGSHSGGLPISDQVNGATVLNGSSSSSSVPGSSNGVLGNDFSSPSVPLNSSVREGRYGMPRTNSLPKDDQQRIQQYNRMLSARNLQHSSLSPGSHSAAERGVRMLPARNGVGVIPGLNRSMTMAARPGFHGVASPSVLSSGMAMANPANMNPRVGNGPPGQGNSTLRARDAMHLMKPNQNGDHRRQILPADFQMQQVSQPPFQSYPPDRHQQPQPIAAQQPPHVLGSNSHDNRNNLHGTPNHTTNTSHPAFGMRILKERQLQQQRVLQIATSNAQKSQQNGTQIQSQSSLPVLHSPIGTPSMAQNAQKHPLLAAPNPQTGGITGGIGNQILKQQRPLQPFQQRQPLPSQPQTKFMNGGRGTKMIQNLPEDPNPTLPNGLSGDQSALKTGQRNLSQPHQQKAYSGQMQVASSNKLSHVKPSLLSDNNNHPNRSPSLVASSSTMPVVTSANHHHPPPQPHPKLVSLSRVTTGKRTVNNNGSVNSSEPPTCKLQAVYNGPSGEHLGAEVNQSMVRGQPSPDSLANPVGHDVGVRWPQLPSS